MVKTSLAAGGGYALLVHGGAGDSQGETLAGQMAGCQRAVEVAKALLESGAHALDAVQAAVEVLEDDARFNAGTGATLTSDGTMELDAAIMEGTTLRAGAICALPPFKHPIAIARAVLEDGRHVLYAADGAVRFAQSQGFERADPGSMITVDARTALAALNAHSAASGGTVGAVARDKQGRLAAATSTGGTLGKRSGRVGDSPIIGAGTYAEDALAAASATGQGEGMLRVSLCVRIALAIGAGAAPADAAHDALRFMKERTAKVGGVIVVAGDGRLALARTTKSMAYACSWERHGIVTGS